MVNLCQTLKLSPHNINNEVYFMEKKEYSDSYMEETIKRFNHLCDIIDNEKIFTVFQPIIDLRTGNIFGYEALTRIQEQTIIKNPNELFITAQQFDQTARLEKLCRKKALLKAHELQMKSFLSINICPSVLKANNHEKGTTAALMRELDTMKNQIILELTERFYIKDYQLFKKTVNYYRDQGFRIAIDDLGAGFSDLKMLAQIEPYMVKIDGFLISNIHLSIKKQRLLKALVTFCHDVNALVTAECVEKIEELEVLINMNVDFAQGYLLAKPDKILTECSKEGYDTIALVNQKKVFQKTDNIHNAIGYLVQYVDPIQDHETVDSVSERFKKNKTLTTLPVLTDNTPVGIVNKRELFYHLGQKYGYDLFYRKSIHSLTESALVFEFNEPIETVAKRVLNRDERSVYDAVIIVKNGLYVGIVKIYHILERITELKIMLAQQANPLTGLPGNMMIKEHIETRLNQKQVFAVIYFDLDHFKPFNDNFGFEQGDCVLQFLGELLKSIISKWDSKSFIGHVGGDDFIAICRAQGVEQLCEMIIEKFDKGITQFHDKETCLNGYYESVDRNGQIKIFKLLSVSMAVITTRERLFQSYAHIASVASEIKKMAKKMNGSSYYVDQRLK